MLYRLYPLLFVLLLQSCSGNSFLKIDTSEPSSIEKDILGKWGMLIQTDGEYSSNRIYLQRHFRDDGIVEQRGDGILYNDKKAAVFSIVETKQWYIRENRIYEKEIYCKLQKNVGDKEFKRMVLEIYTNFKDQRRGKSWGLEIINITHDSLVLKDKEPKESDVNSVYYRIE